MRDGFVSYFEIRMGGVRLEVGGCYFFTRHVFFFLDRNSLWSSRKGKSVRAANANLSRRYAFMWRFDQYGAQFGRLTRTFTATMHNSGSTRRMEEGGGNKVITLAL